MNTSDIESARVIVQAATDSPGKERLLKILAHSERLLKGTITELQSIGPRAASVTQFHDALVELRATLQPVHDILLELDVIVRDTRFAREVTFDMAEAVGTALRPQSRELSELLWVLPSRRRRIPAP